jgi:hypothetical protein
MEDEERIAALTYMNPRDRDAVIAAMPFNDAVAAGLVDPDYEGEEEMLEVHENYDENGDELPSVTRKQSGSSGSGSVTKATKTVSTKAMGAASSARHSLTHSVRQARESDMTMKVASATTSAVGKAKTSLVQATSQARAGAEKSGVYESAMGAMSTASKAARKAKEAIAPSSETQGKAKEKATQAASAASSTASSALSSASKGLASMLKPRPTKR